MGLERRGAGLLRGTSCTGQAARAREVGAGICLPSLLGPMVRTAARPTMTAPAQSRQGARVQRGQQRERLGSWTRGGRDGPMTGRLFRPCDLRPWVQGAPTGLGLIMHSVLQVVGLAHAARTRPSRPKGVHPPRLLLILL